MINLILTFWGAEFRTHRIKTHYQILVVDINVIVDKDVHDIKISKFGKINVVKANIIFNLRKIKYVNYILKSVIIFRCNNWHIKVI